MIVTEITTTNNNPKEVHLFVPKEIMIRSTDLGNDQVMDEYNLNVSEALSRLEGLNSSNTILDQEVGSKNTQERKLRDVDMSPQLNTDCLHVVSSSSSLCSSHGSLLMPIDPLDYRKDWSIEIDIDLTRCINQNPEVFLSVKEDERAFDINSLCSQMSEDYSMDSEEGVKGLWDGE